MVDSSLKFGNIGLTEGGEKVNPEKVRKDELRDRIVASGITQVHIANNLGISTGSLQNKLNGTTEFKITEIVKLSKILGLSNKERDHYFGL